MAYNEEHGIEPKTIRKAISSIMDELSEGKSAQEISTSKALADDIALLGRDEVLRMIDSLEEQMAEASEALDFETAAHLRDQAVSLRAKVESTDEDDGARASQGDFASRVDYGHTQELRQAPQALRRAISIFRRNGRDSSALPPIGGFDRKDNSYSYTVSS